MESYDDQVRLVIADLAPQNKPNYITNRLGGREEDIYKLVNHITLRLRFLVQ